MRLTKRNPETGEYEYKEKAKTLTEFRAQRKAVIQRLGEYEDKASDIAEEIFGEIERQLNDFNGSWADTVINTQYLIAELKKKYTEEGK